MKNVKIRHKISSNEYDSLLPIEQGTGIGFNNGIVNPIGYFGDGDYSLPSPIRAFSVGEMILFFFNNYLFSWDENINKVREYRKYNLNEDEYFVSYIKDTKEVLFLLTNQGNLYRYNSNEKVCDYKEKLKLPIETKFYSMTFYQGNDLESSCFAVSCEQGVYFNMNSLFNPLDELQQMDFSGLVLTSKKIQYCRIIDIVGNKHELVCFTETDIIIVQLRKESAFKSSVLTFGNDTIGKFKFIQNNVVIGSQGIWMPKENYYNIIKTETEHITSVVPISTKYNGYLFNDIYWTVVYLREFNSSAHSFDDLKELKTLTMQDKNCLLFLSSLTEIFKIGITQKGEVISIKGN